PPKQRGDVVALIEGGDDDRKLKRRGGLRRVFGARSDGFIHAASVYPPLPRKPRRSSGGERVKNRANQAPKCQRPRKEGARTCGAAELFSGRPSAGAMKHRRRR